MKKKNNNKKMSMLLSLAFLFAMVGLVVVSDTYAKYTTKLTGSDTATVAKWAWEIDETAVESDTTTFTIDLFTETVLDSNGTDEEDDVDGVLIAPGTMGKMSFTVKNLSEVTGVVDLKFALDGTSATIPLEFSDDEGVTWATIEDFELTAGQEVAMKTGTQTYNIWWRWVYEGSDVEDTLAGLDAADTKLGFDAASGTVKAIVNATLTFTQKD